MKKQALVWLCGLLIMLTLTGCWDRREINDVGFVIVSALDVGKEPGTYLSTVRIAIPKKMGGGQTGSSGGQQGPPYMTIAAENRSLDKNRIDLEKQMSREMLTAHRRVLVFGEKIAKRGLKEVLDEFSRNPQNRLRTLLVITKGMEAKDFLKEPYALEPFPSEALREMIKQQMEFPTTLRDFFVQSTLPGREPSLAAFSISKGQYPRYMLNHVAIFRDFKLVGYLEGNEIMLLNSIIGKNVFGFMRIGIPEVPGKVSVQVREIKVKEEVKKKGDQLTFSFTAQAIGSITETDSPVDLSNPRYIEQYNKAFAKQLEKEYAKLFEKLQKTYKADSAGLGNMVYRKDPAYWKKIEKKWPEMYPKQKVTWKVESVIRDIGATGAPMQLPEKEVTK
ncbi:Ger(x)C family spore germination protein [Brevibacillus migulae]|uniref:Ger(x)C family spore germination protein n=1 Tax=Brevibacillus migulae TaxID=1644114 RepID=UPI00106E1D65|nr:Ger(x)C family spore germination protein [Brevibacillus migulae]